MGEQLNCTVREAVESDLEWIKECLALRMDVALRLSERKQMVLDLIARDEVVTTMAVNVENEDAFYGFCIYEHAAGPVPPFVHYLYVRKFARRMGVARRLLEGLEGRVEVACVPRFKVPDRFVLNVNRSVL